MSRLTIYGVEFRSHALLSEITATPADRRAQDDRGVGDEAWHRIAPMIAAVRAGSRHGRRPIDDRAALDGIIDVLASGSSWRELPRSRYHVSGVTCWRRLRAWQRDGIWPAIAEELHLHGVDLSDPGDPPPGAGQP
jgi:hypothetical protein